MDRVGRAADIVAGVAIAALTATLWAKPAPRFHEDQPARVPGPELGHYL